MPNGSELEKARAAIRPQLHDIAIASEVILATAQDDGPLNTDHLFDLVARRLESDPLPEIATGLNVREADLRRVRANAVAVTAIAELEARGLLMPLVGSYAERSWSLAWYTPQGGGATHNVDEGYNYRLAAAYRRSRTATIAPAVDAPANFLEQLPPSMGPKVRRLLREAVDAYRSGLFLAAAVLVGIASEAAWGQLARAILTATGDARLRELLDAPFQSAAAIQRQAMELLGPKGLRRNAADLNALGALEQIYRDLRNYAAHRPDESFDESRVTRATVGTLLDGSVDYFRRLYELHDRLEARSV